MTCALDFVGLKYAGYCALFLRFIEGSCDGFVVCDFDGWVLPNGVCQ